MWLSFWSYWNPVSILVVPNIRKRSFWTCFQKVRWARGIVFQICNQWTVVSLNMYLMIWLNWDRMMFLFTNATFDWLIHVFCYCTCDVCVLCCVLCDCCSSFEQDREICLWKILLLPGTSWRTTTVQGEVLWSPKNHCSAILFCFLWHFPCDGFDLFGVWTMN